jgi:hypothetical protein
LLHDEPTDALWLPYLGDALDSGIKEMQLPDMLKNLNRKT